MAVRTYIVSSLGYSELIPIAGVEVLENFGNGKSLIKVIDGYTRLWLAGRIFSVSNELLIEVPVLGDTVDGGDSEGDDFEFTLDGGDADPFAINLEVDGGDAS